MQIFGRDVPSAEELWNLYDKLISRNEVWHKETFATAAKLCGLKRVYERKSGYFSCAAFAHATGQAPVAGVFIEEIRLFLSEAPRDVTVELWERESSKHKLLGKKYSEMFESKLGPPRIANDNKIFESNGFQVRVLVRPPVWVVISNLDVVKQLPNDCWSAAPQEWDSKLKITFGAENFESFIRGLEGDGGE
jgi:hypothetical protein